MLQVQTHQLIVHERLSWQEMQVLLEGLAYKVAVKALKEGLLTGLASQESKHAPGHTHKREVLVLVDVLI